MENTWTYIQLKPGDLIRTRYKGEWEYSQLIDAAEGKRILLCGQADIEAWKQGTPIPPLMFCNDQRIQDENRKIKEALRDGTTVIECVWKGERLEPRRKSKT